jgi:hypothetical protein
MSREEEIVAMRNKAFFVLEHLPDELRLRVYEYVPLFSKSPEEKATAAIKRAKSLDANSDVCGMESPIIKQLKQYHKAHPSQGSASLLTYYLWESTFAAWAQDAQNMAFIRAWLKSLGDAEDPLAGFGVSCLRDVVFWTGISIHPARDYDKYVRIRILLTEKPSAFAITTNAPYEQEQSRKDLGKLLVTLRSHLQQLVQVRRVGTFLLRDWLAIVEILVAVSRYFVGFLGQMANTACANRRQEGYPFCTISKLGRVKAMTRVGGIWRQWLGFGVDKLKLQRVGYTTIPRGPSESSNFNTYTLCGIYPSTPGCLPQLPLGVPSKRPSAYPLAFLYCPFSVPILPL